MDPWGRGRTVVELGGGGGVEVSRGGARYRAFVLTWADGRSLGQLQPARCAVWHRNGFAALEGPPHMCDWPTRHAGGRERTPEEPRLWVVTAAKRVQRRTRVRKAHPPDNRVTSNTCGVPLAGAGERCYRLGRTCEEVAIGGRCSHPREPPLHNHPEPRHHAGASPTPHTGTMANAARHDNASESFRLLSEVKDVPATIKAHGAS